MKRPIHFDACSGIGGFALAAHWADFETIQFVEIGPYCQKMLAKNFPGVPIHDDIRTYATSTLRSRGIGHIDLFTAGFPCQDISNAGKRGGITGKQSSLWGEVFRLICEIRPRFVVVENVAALLNRGMGTVLGDLASARYDAEWSVLSACSLGAPHTRDRVFIVAYPHGIQRKQYGRLISEAFRSSERNLYKWKSEPVPTGVAHGIPNRMDRLRGLGNAIVPQVAYPILAAIHQQLTEVSL